MVLFSTSKQKPEIQVRSLEARSLEEDRHTEAGRIYKMARGSTELFESIATKAIAIILKEGTPFSTSHGPNGWADNEGLSWFRHGIGIEYIDFDKKGGKEKLRLLDITCNDGRGCNPSVFTALVANGEIMKVFSFAAKEDNDGGYSHALWIGDLTNEFNEVNRGEKAKRLQRT